MSFYDPSPETAPEPAQIALSERIPLDATPVLGETPPQVLARNAAEGRRGAAWRLLHRVMANDPRALEAITLSRDARLVRHVLEFIALGTWAGQPFDVPASLRTPYARTRLRTLFVPQSGFEVAVSEPLLLAALHDPRLAVRETAIHLLGIMGSSSAVPQLLTALHDPVPTIREQAIKALGRTGSPDAVPALLHALHGSDERQGSQVFQALVSLGHVAVPGLLEASRSSAAWVRWQSIRALGEIHDGRAFSRLIEALTDSDHGVAWMAAKSLLPFGKECVLPVLRLLITAEPTRWLAETASYVLSSQFLGHAELKPYLEPVIREMHRSDYKTGTCYTAMKALGQLETGHFVHSFQASTPEA